MLFEEPKFINTNYITIALIVNKQFSYAAYLFF